MLKNVSVRDKKGHLWWRGRSPRHHRYPFHWSGLFFAYVDYEDTPQGLSAVDLYRILNLAQSSNIVVGVMSETGRAFQSIIDRSAQP